MKSQSILRSNIVRRYMHFFFNPADRNTSNRIIILDNDDLDDVSIIIITGDTSFDEIDDVFTKCESALRGKKMNFYRDHSPSVKLILPIPKEDTESIQCLIELTRFIATSEKIIFISKLDHVIKLKMAVGQGLNFPIKDWFYVASAVVMNELYPNSFIAKLVRNIVMAQSLDNIS